MEIRKVHHELSVAGQVVNSLSRARKSSANGDGQALAERSKVDCVVPVLRWVHLKHLTDQIPSMPAGGDHQTIHRQQTIDLPHRLARVDGSVRACFVGDRRVEFLPFNLDLLLKALGGVTCKWNALTYTFKQCLDRFARVSVQHDVR